MPGLMRETEALLARKSPPNRMSTPMIVSLCVATLLCVILISVPGGESASCPTSYQRAAVFGAVMLHVAMFILPPLLGIRVGWSPRCVVLLGAAGLVLCSGSLAAVFSFWHVEALNCYWRGLPPALWPANLLCELRLLLLLASAALAVFIGGWPCCCCQPRADPRNRSDLDPEMDEVADNTVFGWAGVIGYGLWAVNSLIDDFDGAIARSTGSTSELGQWFDHALLDPNEHCIVIAAVHAAFPELGALWLITLFRNLPFMKTMFPAVQWSGFAMMDPRWWLMYLALLGGLTRIGIGVFCKRRTFKHQHSRLFGGIASVFVIYLAVVLMCVPVGIWPNGAFSKLDWSTDAYRIAPKVLAALIGTIMLSVLGVIVARATASSSSCSSSCSSSSK